MASRTFTRQEIQDARSIPVFGIPDKEIRDEAKKGADYRLIRGHAKADITAVFTQAAVRKACAPDKGPTPHNESVRNPKSPGWDENLGFDGARGALIRGLPSVKLTRLQQELTRHLKMREGEQIIRRPSYKRGRLVVSDYARGRARPLRERKRVVRPTRVIRVGVQLCSSWNVNSEVWTQRGAAVLALISQAERLGIQMQLDAVIDLRNLVYSPRVSHKTRQISIVCPLTRPGMRAPRRVVAFWLTHSAAFRRCGFRLMETLAGDYGTDIAGGYGNVAEFAETVKIANDRQNRTTLLREGYDLWVPMWNNTRTPEDLIKQAVAWSSGLFTPSGANHSLSDWEDVK